MRHERHSLPKRVMNLLEQAGPDGAAVSQLAEQVEADPRSVRQAVQRLSESGVVDRYAHGRVRLGSKPAIATTAGEEIWKLLATQDAGYITGLDVLGGKTQHFVFEFPHLVVVDPVFLDEINHQLAQAGFVAAPLGRSPVSSDVDRLVIVRASSGWRAPVYQVRENVAPAELAWIDLYRAARRGEYPMDAAELGRLLNTLTRDPRTERRLRVLAQRHYADELLPVLDRRPVTGFALGVAQGYQQ